MTEQEGEALAAKMTRIWSVLAPFVVEVDTDGARLLAQRSQDVELEVGVLDGDFHYFLHETGSSFTFLYCDGGDRVTSRPLFPKSRARPLTESLLHRQSHWLPFFRRGCWLSGCPIEASAHEKAEWIRGFTREEVESWNLKM